MIATCTVQPMIQVAISSGLSGTVAAVGVGYNQTVAAGEVLARLDDTNLRAHVLNAGAQLAAPRARLASAGGATVTEPPDALNSAEALDRRGLNIRSVIVAARAAHDRAVAAVGISRADVTLAVTLVEANLASVRTDPEKAEIRSPIDSIVLDREAEQGQIVAASSPRRLVASLNAPGLFTLAGNLRRMEPGVSGDEAAISRGERGRNVTFTVDAWARAAARGGDRPPARYARCQRRRCGGRYGGAFARQ